MAYVLKKNIQWFFIWTVVTFPSIQTSNIDKKDLLPNVCGQILDGVLDHIRTHPWNALLEYKTKQNHTRYACHAALISKRYLVTAAHCVHHKRLKLITPVNVVLRNCAKSDQGCEPNLERIPIEKCIYHPKFNSTSLLPKDDIALVRLAQEVPVSDFISPICLPETNTSYTVNKTRFEFMEWGISHMTDFETIFMRHSKYPLVDRGTCQEAYTKRKIVVDLVDTQICAGGSVEMDLCPGTAGGSLLHSAGHGYEVAGVVNFGGMKCARTNLPFVSTKVSDYRDWIVEQMEP